MNNNNTISGGLDRNPIQAEPGRIPIRTAPNDLILALTNLYQELGLPDVPARKAALADLECDFGTLALAA